MYKGEEADLTELRAAYHKMRQQSHQNTANLQHDKSTHHGSRATHHTTMAGRKGLVGRIRKGHHQRVATRHTAAAGQAKYAAGQARGRAVQSAARAHAARKKRLTAAGRAGHPVLNRIRKIGSGGQRVNSYTGKPVESELPESNRRIEKKRKKAKWTTGDTTHCLMCGKKLRKDALTARKVVCSKRCSDKLMFD
jgi:hypothetical protein